MDTTYGTENGNGFLSKLLTFVKSSPVPFFLASLILLGLILPPRKRKAKRAKKQKRAKRKRLPVQKRKVRKIYAPRRKNVVTRRKRVNSGKPARLIKGSLAAKRYMASIRSKRRRK